MYVSAQDFMLDKGDMGQCGVSTRLFLNKLQVKVDSIGGCIRKAMEEEHLSLESWSGSKSLMLVLQSFHRCALPQDVHSVAGFIENQFLHIWSSKGQCRLVQRSESR